MGGGWYLLSDWYPALFPHHSSFCKQNPPAFLLWGSGHYCEALCRGDALAVAESLHLRCQLVWQPGVRVGEGEQGAEPPGGESREAAWLPSPCGTCRGCGCNKSLSKSAEVWLPAVTHLV